MSAGVQSWIVEHGHRDARTITSVLVERAPREGWSITCDGHSMVLISATKRSAIASWARLRGMIRPTVTGPVTPIAGGAT